MREALYDMTGVDLTAIVGIDEIHALTLVGELGCDMTKWPTVRISDFGFRISELKTTTILRNAHSAIRNPKSEIRRLAAWALMRSRSYLGAYLRRQRSRLGAPKAITATAHKLARIVYNLLRFGLPYVRQQEAAYAEQVRDRLEKQLRRRAKELGYELVKPMPASESDAAPNEPTKAEPSSVA